MTPSYLSKLILLRLKFPNANGRFWPSPPPPPKKNVISQVTSMLSEVHEYGTTRFRQKS
jgi:hypothetical protein